jgi:hypothetical protein
MAMRRKWFLSLTVTLTAVLLGCATTPLESQDIPRMTTAELRANLDNPQVVILDVRTPRDWNRSPTKIKGAVRVDSNWTTETYPRDSLVVLYCT